jgi:hypothetical protein
LNKQRSAGSVFKIHTSLSGRYCENLENQLNINRKDKTIFGFVLSFSLMIGDFSRFGLVSAISAA